MNLEQIETFIHVALSGSFSKAGETLFLSQPSVSSRIKTLENELGCILFVRNGKNVYLTKHGHLFLPYAKEVVKNIQEGIFLVQKANSTQDGELLIAFVYSAVNLILPSIVKEFQKNYPKVRLVVYTGHSHDVMNMVINSEVSLGITRSIFHPDIESKLLIKDNIELVVFPQHRFSSRSEVSIEELSKEPLILFNRGSVDWTLIHNVFNRVNLVPNIVMEVDSIEGAKQMVMKGVGITLLSHLSVEEEVQKERLKTIKIIGIPVIKRDYELIYSKNKDLDGISKLFIDFIFKSLPTIKHEKS